MKKRSRSKAKTLFFTKLSQKITTMKWLKPVLIILGIFIFTWGIAYLLYTRHRPIGLVFATAVGGEINSDTVWKLGDSPFLVTSDITITSGALLTIESGAEVYFNGIFSISVEDGSIIAEGEGLSPIIFDSSAATPESPGLWGNIHFGELSGSGSFRYAQFRRAGNGGYATLRINGGDVTVANCEFDLNYIGVSVAGTSASVQVNNSEFTDYTVPVAIVPESNAVLGSGNVLGESSLSPSYRGISLVETLSDTSYEVPECPDDLCVISSRDFGSVSNIPYVIPKTLGGDVISLALGAQDPGYYTVSIDPGVIIKLDGGAVSSKKSRIESTGTLTDPVFFTSIKDDLVGGDTNNDGLSSSPDKGDWENVRLNASAEGEGVEFDDSGFEYTIFRYAGSNGAIFASDEPYTAINSTFYNNEVGTRLVFTDVSMMDNQVTQCNFFDNNLAVENVNGDWVELPGNWWGASNGPADEEPPAGICVDTECNDGSGDTVDNYVRYDPFSVSAWNVLPAPSYVYDGTGADVDYITSTTTASGNWASVSGAVSYEYCIGTSVSECDTLGWTGSGTATSARATGLTLSNSVNYYFMARAINYFGPGVRAYSNGFVVDSISPDDPFELDQLSMAGESIGYGESISERSMRIRFMMADGGGSPRVYPQVEVVEFGYPFTGRSVVEGDGVQKREMEEAWVGEVVVTGLTSGKGYHWQARVRDEAGNYSGWVPYVSLFPTYDSRADFSVYVPNSLVVVPEGQTLVQGIGVTGTPKTQTAGVASGTFYIYSVDGNYRITTGYSTTASISVNDPYPSVLTPNSVVLSSGVGSFKATFYTASSSGWVISAEDTKGLVLGGQSGAIPVKAGNPSSSSTLTISPDRVYADGIEKATIEVTFRDTYGNLVSGIIPLIAVSGERNTLSSPSRSNANGVSRVELASTTAQTKTVTASYIATSFDRVELTGRATFYDSILSPAAVRDGLVSPDIDYQTATDRISANWDGVEGQYLEGYEFAVTTNPSLEDTVEWTSVEQVLQYTATGLSLQVGETYFVKVRAYNTLGNRSEPTVSDGVMVIDPDDPPPGYVPSPGDGDASSGTITGAVSSVNKFVQDTGVLVPVVNSGIGVVSVAVPLAVTMATAGLGVAEGLAFLAQGSAFWRGLLGAPFGLVKFKRKKKLPWNTVYDGVTKNPLPFAVIRLKTEGDKVLNTIVADELGRFTYLPPASDYKIEPAMAGYVFPSSSITAMKDDPYGRVYRGEKLNGGEPISSLAVPMDKMRLSLKRPVHLNIIGFFGQVLFFGGYVWTLYCAIASLMWYNIALLGFYTAICAHIVASRIRKARSFGTIRDARSGKALTGVNIYLVNKVTGQAIDTRITDETGRFQIFANEGEYLLKVMHPAFESIEEKLSVGKAGKLITKSFALTKRSRKANKPEAEASGKTSKKPKGAKQKSKLTS